ncbi:MAG: hypothetical protein ACI8XO_003290 [Verrucomicrobiales bacterium]
MNLEIVAAQAPSEPSGTGVRQPSNEELIEKASKSSVKADAIWIEITTVGKEASRWVLDLNRQGSCHVLLDEGGARTIYGGTGISMNLVKRAFTSLTKRSVIYGERGRSGDASTRRELVSIGMATWDGSRVYKTQSGALDTFPEEVRAVVDDLRKTAEHLPVSRASGSIQATFLRPSEARRLMEGGKKIVKVEDPGKNHDQVTTLDLAIRVPGRDIVVPTEDHWGVLDTYVLASNPNNPGSGEFYVQSSKRIYRITMNAASSPDDGLEDGLIPKARPVK